MPQSCPNHGPRSFNGKPQATASTATANRKPNLSIQAAKKNEPAELLIYDDIGPDWAGMIGGNTIAKALKEIGPADKITVRLNSPGGSVFEGTTIYNQLKNHKAKITVAIDGLAASIASIIAMAGDDIQIAENAMMMIHDPVAIAIGGAEDMLKMAELLEQVKDTLVGTYSKRAGDKLTDDEIASLMGEETWFTAKEAVEKGLADSISENKTVTAKIDPAVYGFKHVPERFRAEGDDDPRPRDDDPRPRDDDPQATNQPESEGGDTKEPAGFSRKNMARKKLALAERAA